MRAVVVAVLLGVAAANFAPTIMEAPEMGFKLNVLKNSEKLTGCPDSSNGAYTVVSLMRTDKERTRILNPYVVKLLMQCKVQEVHTWDLYKKEDGHLAGEMTGFDDKVPEMLKMYDDWRQRFVKSKFAEFYSKYEIPDKKKAVLLKMDDSVLYMDIGNVGQATTYALEHPENFLALPNMVSGATAAFHQKCFPDAQAVLNLGNDRKTAITHRLFLKNPSCFSLTEAKECVELDSGLDNSGTPTGAYLVHWDNIDDLSNLLKMSVGDESALFSTTRKSCILSSTTMASICPSLKQSEDIYMPVYKLLSKKIQAGSRITDDGLSEELLRDHDLEDGLPKKSLELFAKQEGLDQPMCPRIRSYVDLKQCQAPQKTHMKWLQLKETTPSECRRPCTAAPVELQGAHFVSEEKKLALFSSPKLSKPLNELFQTKGLNIAAANPQTSYDSNEYNVVVAAHEPLNGFAQSFTNFMKAMKQIGVDKRSLKQTIAHCKTSPGEEGCQALLQKKLPVLEKWIDLESFDHKSDKVTASLIQSVFKDINRLVYPGCEAQLGAGTTPQLAAFLPSYLTIQAKKPFHVLREEYAEEDLQNLWQKLGMHPEEAKAASALSEFGYSSETKTDAIAGADDLKKDLMEAMSLLQNKDAADSTIKAMEEIAQDVDARVEFDSQMEEVKKLIKGSPELTKSFCSIYSMDYSCLGYGEEFEKMCGAVDGPEKVTMKKDFVLKVSTPKLTMRQKQAMRAMEQKSCLTASGSQISFSAFVDTVENCKAQCQAKAGCSTYNYDSSTFGCHLYSSAPLGVVRDLHSTCGAVCQNNDAGLARAVEARGLHTIGASCAASAEYCSHEDVALNCGVTCGLCSQIDL